MIASKPRSAAAPTVSATLRRAGILPTPPSFEGVHVRRSLDGSLVAIDIDQARHAAVIRDAVVEALTDAGYTLRSNPSTSFLIYVTSAAL